MAIQKRFIHFKKFSDFNSKKLSANEANTQYTVGVSGAIQNGEPDVLYQSYCWIKDTQQQWTHGQLYNCSITDNVHITDFTISDLLRLIADPDLSIQADTLRLRDALAEHKVVLVPYDSDDMLRGYGIAVGYSEDLLYVTIMLDNGSIYIETNIDGEEIRSSEVSRRQYHESVEQMVIGDLDRVAMVNGIHTAIGDMTYAFPDTITGEEDDVLLSRGTVKTINGQSIVGSGDITIQGGEEVVDNVYITDFTVNDLRSIEGRDQESIQCQMQHLYEAVAANKLILVPWHANEGVQGYGVAVGYYEDFIYLTILLGGEFIDLELDLDNDEINGGQVALRGWYDKQNKLVSGTNIKTINGQPILGSGNISIQGGEINVNSDWLEPDNTVDSYVKNRTHYLTGTKITSAGSYSIGTSTPIYYREKRYNLEIGVRTQIDTDRAGVYVTLGDDGILLVEDITNLLGTYPIMAISGVVPLDDMFIPETIARKEETNNVYVWNWDGAQAGLITQQEYNSIANADYMILRVTDEEGITNGAIFQLIKYVDYIEAINHTFTEGIVTELVFRFTNNLQYDITSMDLYVIPVNTSQLKNDSNFITSDGLKTINGESIVGSGNLTIEGGSGGNYVGKGVLGDTTVAYIQGFDTGNMVYGLPNAEANGDADDYLVSRNTLKTINGESILGSGNISISGGSGGGKEYVYAPLSVEPGGKIVEFTLTKPFEPNKVYVAKEAVSGMFLGIMQRNHDLIGEEYTLMFQAATSDFRMTLPDKTFWANGIIPTIEANTYYEISIVSITFDKYSFNKAVLTPFKQVE